MAISALVFDADTMTMLGVREGDTTSFELLLRKHRGPVVRFLWRMVHDQGVAEELAQEVFLRVYRAREKYEPTAKLNTWLFRIATHLAINWLRDHNSERANTSLDAPVRQGSPRLREVADPAVTAEHALVRRCRLAEVKQAVCELPERQRAAVLMHKFEEMEYARIAVTLNISEQAVKSLLFRAYSTLRRRLAHIAPRV